MLNVLIRSIHPNLRSNILDILTLILNVATQENFSFPWRTVCLFLNTWDRLGLLSRRLSFTSKLNSFPTVELTSELSQFTGFNYTSRIVFHASHAYGTPDLIFTSWAVESFFQSWNISCYLFDDFLQSIVWTAYSSSTTRSITGFCQCDLGVCNLLVGSVWWTE